MCGLYGLYNYSRKGIKNLSKLTNSLAEQSAVRGTDATGISYVDKGKLVVYKQPKSAYSVNFRHDDKSVCVMGHTRHATQGDKKKNYNNHPFKGKCKDMQFSLCHNGVITNDNRLRKEYELRESKIETDSYIAVQLIEKKDKLDFESIKFMAEAVSGSFSFSLLGQNNVLWLVKGDSPLSVVHLVRKNIYVYASTDEILYKALVDTDLFDEIKKGYFEEISINRGDILKFDTDGKIIRDKFSCSDYDCMDWWEYGNFDFYSNKGTDNDDYIKDLKIVAAYQGYPDDTVDKLIDNGFTLEEIEEYIYFGVEDI